MAPQLITTNGPLRYWLCRWIACATSSFPVPLSPVIRTGTSVAGHLPHRGKDLLHLRACPQHPLEVAIPPLQLKLGILPLERGDVQGPLQDRPELADVDGLVEDVIGPAGNRLQGVLLLGAARDDDDLEEGVDCKGLGKDGKPLLDARGVGRQSQIQDHDGRLAFTQLGHGALPGPRPA